MTANKQNRRYTVKFDTGEFRKRNRKHLLPIMEKEYVFQERRRERKLDLLKNKDQGSSSRKRWLIQKPKYLKYFVKKKMIKAEQQEVLHQ